MAKHETVTKADVDAKIAAIPSDDVAATPSLRTLGSGAQQAAAGDHTHTLTLTQAFYDGSTGASGTTSWVTKVSTSIPANAKKVMAWCFGTSETSLKEGYCRTLYNGVQGAYSSGAYFFVNVSQWAGDGLGFAANLDVQIKRHSEADYVRYGYGARYVTIG
ncbi:hypothetical protein ES707_00173 [subsurface metagenome]